MKIAALIMIIAYLILPALCFGETCEPFSAQAQHSPSTCDHSDDVLPNHDVDNCEKNCCCAGHVPLSLFRGIAYVEPAARLLPYEPRLALPRLIDRIFIPPRNFA
jgi:hypothetical protein